MPDITCPECGYQTDLPAIRRAAEEFCGHCDYPLFWAPSSIPVTTPGANSDATLRRLPGAGGRQRIGSKICPDCGELNPITETHCLRCTAELDPRPPEPEAEPAPPPPRPVPPPAPVLAPWYWWWPLAASAAFGLVVVLIITLAT